ncbi:rRNA maturation RNase YbeY [Paenibacillus sp. 1P07SE]|uniref:rRNA maturation RNase YbeY n=1 Tax=Paenibacillus sp. 1P07SE TaxID=3132209 RepID=UPI0039A6C36F
MSMQLDWSNEQAQVDIPDAWIARLEQLMQLAAEAEGLGSGEVALTFVDDAEIHRLNRDFRKIDRPTDVLSFAMQEEGEEEAGIVFDEEAEGAAALVSDMLGDIIISAERAKAQSLEYGHSLEREVGFLFVHGFLHLLGYDHQDEAGEQEMTAKQEAVLAKAGLSR